MFCRHNRVWLSALGWERALTAVPAEYAAQLMRWAENGWPVIVRRTESGTGPDTICLGLPLPPDSDTGVKIRIPFSACIEHIERHELPLAIADSLDALPATWQAAFTGLAAAAAFGQLNFHAYGSAAMQAMTGLAYLSAASDIDLLFYPHSKPQLQEGLALLSAYAEHLPLDGEIVFPSGRAVAWKEWAQANENPARMRVIAKSVHSVQLVNSTELHDEFGNQSWSM